MGKLMDALLGPRCGLCGRRVDAVFAAERGSDLKVGKCCKRTLAAADRSAPHGSRAASYRAGSGKPPHLAGPMGARYRGPEPPPQRRR